VVKTSVFRKSVPDLQLTGDHFVGTLFDVGEPTRPTQPSDPPGRKMNSNPCNVMDYGGGDYVWLQAKVRECGLGQRLRLYAGHFCETQRHPRSSMRIMGLNKCYALAFILAVRLSGKNVRL